MTVNAMPIPDNLHICKELILSQKTQFIPWMSTATSRVVPAFFVNDGELSIKNCGGKAVTGGAVGCTGTIPSMLTQKLLAV